MRSAEALLSQVRSFSSPPIAMAIETSFYISAFA